MTFWSYSAVWTEFWRFTTTSTRVRKYFHLLMLLVHTIGVHIYPNFLYLFTNVAVSIFAVLEAIRVYN